MNANNKAVIIGSGVAGLATAIRLAVQGFDTMVYEKNSFPGGKLHDLSVKGYHFDAGPSLFTQPFNIEELFTLADEPIAEYLQYAAIPVSCHYFYQDGSAIKAFANREDFAREIAAKTMDSEYSLHAYLNQSATLYDRIATLFLNFSLHKKSTLVKAPVWKALIASRWPYLFRSLHQLNAKHFKDPKTVQLFNRYATYNGSNPYRAPGLLSLIAHLEHNEGSYYPQGGMISIANALYKLAVKKGVKFYFGSTVQRIIHHEGKVEGVVVNGQNIPAGIVVSNMDAYFTHKYLLKDERKAKKMLRQERSSSALIFYWGIKKEFPELGLHNILFSGDYRTEFDNIFNRKKIDADPTVYINITGKLEPGKLAPAGAENWFVMINVPANNGQDWDTFRQQARAAVIKKINSVLNTDIEPLIDVEETADPVSLEAATATYMGSLYGTSSNTKSAAFLRHPNFLRSIRNLYFVGGSVHPGGGIPLCLKSAKIVGNLIGHAMEKHPSTH